MGEIWIGTPVIEAMWEYLAKDVLMSGNGIVAIGLRKISHHTWPGDIINILEKKLFLLPI